MDNNKKKVIRQSNTRRSIQEKLNEAMAKKPTKAFFAKNGFLSPTEQARKERLIQRKINDKSKKRTSKLPKTHEPTFTRTPFEYPAHKLTTMPDWFVSTKEVDISIIIPCFKSEEFLKEQIASWDLTDDGLTKEIIYVDDHCPLQSHKVILEAWEKRKDEVKTPIGKIVVNSKNSGFASTCNVGASYATGKYLIFLNADTTVTPNWVKPFHDAFQDQSIGIVGNLILRKDGTIDSCGSEWDWKVASFLHVGRQIYNKKRLDRPFTLETAPPELLTPHDVEMVTGACLGIRSQLFKKIGGFDTEYRIGYWEDTELNMRVHTQGYRVHFIPNSIIYHKVGHTHSAAHAYMRENQRLFTKRWVETKLFEGYLNGKRPDIKTIPIEKDSIVVYTAITGDYDELKDQPKSENTEFVAFMNQEVESKTWQYQPICCEFNEPNRNAKIHKVMPHLFFPEKEYSLWMDGSVRIEFPFSIEKLIEIYLSDCDLAVFNHPDRNCIYQEANACIARKLDDPEVIRKQVNRYTHAGYPANNGLCECSVLLRRHTPKIQEFNEMWWNEIKNGSKRDQISFNFVLNKLKVPYRTFPGDLRRTNYLFKREEHKRGRR